MVKGKEEQQVEKIQEIDETTPEVESPTSEQQGESLQAQLELLKTERDKALSEAKRLEDGYKGLQTRLNKTNDDLRRQAGIDSRIDAINERIELLATAIASGTREEDLNEIPSESRKAILNQLKQMRESEQKSRQDAESKLKTEEQFKHFDEVWNEAQKFGTYDDNDQVAEIYDALIDQKLYRAERILKKLQVSKEKSMPAKESEEEMRKRIEKEVKEQIFKERGWNIVDGGGPVGGSGSLQEIEKNFIEGKISVDKLPPELLRKYR